MLRELLIFIKMYILGRLCLFCFYFSRIKLKFDSRPLVEGLAQDKKGHFH